MIDLRSDTVTKPDRKMLRVIAEAEVGDDVFSEDPTTNKLQEYMADLFGKEAGLFVSSGVMGNQLAIKSLTEPGDEVIVESQSHIFFYETSAPSLISGVQLNCLDSERGMPPLNAIKGALRPKDYYFPKTSLICLENTHNRHSGTIINLEYIKDVASFARTKNVKMHLDGARLWNAMQATGIKADEWAEDFDTVTVCFSKGLGAPIGSMLLGSKKIINKARKWRKILGGGMRQTGILAAAALYAVNNNLKKIEQDNNNAKNFAAEIAQESRILIDISKVDTNIVYFSLKNKKSFNKFINNCNENGLLLIPLGEKTARAVFHLGISKKDTVKAVGIVHKCLK